MEISVLASGSTGNAYIVRDSGRSILIEAGLTFKKLQELSGFSLSDMDFCLISHEHKDHSRAFADMARVGIPVAMSQGTFNALGQNMDTLPVILNSEKLWIFGEWSILPFSVEHDAAEPLGFLILSPSGKKICYATDTYYVRYNFHGVTHWMIEANYSEELLRQNNSLPEDTKLRIRTSHFEIKNVAKFFEKQDLEKTEMIYLIHLSDDNSDEKVFIKILSNTIQSPCAGSGLTGKESSGTSSTIRIKTFDYH